VASAGRRTVTGSVRDRHGAPVLGAEVALRAAIDGTSWMALSGTSDRFGAFAIDDVDFERADLEATATGHAPLFFENQALPEPGRPLEIVLDAVPAKTLTVLVLDPAGRTVPATVSHRLRSAWRWAEETADGAGVFPDVPALESTVEARAGDRS